MFLFPTLFLAFPLVFEVVCDIKMMITHGEPDNFTTSTTVSLSWNQCVSECLKDSLCMVAYQLDDQNCQIFEIGKISTAKRVSNGNNFLAIKVSSASETCPADMSSVENGYGLDNSTDPTFYYPYTVTYSNPLWFFKATGNLTCPTTFKMYIRPKGPWCMQTVDGKTCQTYQAAINQCKSYFNGQLSGPNTPEEYEDLLNRALDFWKNRTTAHPIYCFWMDGKRKSTCQVRSATCNGTNEFSFTDPTLSTVPQGYSWMQAQPGQDGSCIALRIQKTPENGMDDCSCTTSGNGNVCFRGYVCGMKPV